VAAEQVPDDPGDTFVAVDLSGSMGQSLSQNSIAAQFNALEDLSQPDKHGYRETIDDWMQKGRT
jgi:hypothetical protein